MNDRYQQFASNPWGQKILASLNLPTPLPLIRAPFTPESPLRGRVLVAATTNGPVLQSLLGALQELRLTVDLPESSQSLFRNDREIAPLLAQAHWLRLEKLRGEPEQRIARIVFDATALDSSDQLAALYRLFHPVLDNLARHARVLLIGRSPSTCPTAAAAAAQEGLQGFIRSLAKELGKLGATANLLVLDGEALPDLRTSLAFFLGPASAFVSGQALTLTRQPLETPSVIALAARPLHGRTALVTGAARGIGAAIARSLHARGAKVIGVDLEANREALKAAMRALRGKSLVLDIAAPDTPQRILSTLQKAEHPADIVVHNAGVTRDKTLRRMTPSQWNQTLEINLGAIQRIDHELLDQGLLAPGARLIYLSSISGIAGNFGQTNYATSKAALLGYVQALGRQLAGRATANAIAPGFIETEMTRALPMATREMARRINSLAQGGLPEDIAEAVSYLAHPASVDLNGQTLRVCGQNPIGR